MRRVFVDTFYWIAVTNPKDQWRHAAMEASRALSATHLFTTDEVLIEVMNAFSGAGRVLRREAIDLVRDLRSDENVTVCPQSQESFISGVALYEARPDKAYSVTDCISMTTMRREGISEVLTNDDHFSQEGFVKLL